jgi:hypothetical protein
MTTNFNKWIIITCLMALLVPGITAGINYFMDPLWCFSLSHKYNAKQDDFNERQQKTNYITYHDFNYQGLIMGSSTSTNINQNSFKGITVYNYSINGLQPVEYLPYIRYAMERNGKDFEYIFMGLDFMYAAELPPPKLDPAAVFSETRSPLYRLKTLISLDTLKFSRRNLMNYLYGRHIYYDRNNIKYSTTLTRDVQDYNMNMLLKLFEKSDHPFAFNNYKYDEEYRSILKRIRDDNPKTRFVVFTTPVVLRFMVLMVRNNLLDEYLQWIKDIVEVYGECYHFMYPNKITGDYVKYFHDPNHYYPFVSDMMADEMFNHKITSDTGFGMYINRENLDRKLARLELLMKEAAARNP